MAGEKPLAVCARDELGHLRREEACQLRALPFHGFEQAGVRDRDRRLVGERLDERDLLLGERLRLCTRHADHADQVVLEHDRHAQHRAVRPRPRVEVLRVLEHVLDVDGRAGDRGAARRRRAVERVGMLAVVLDALLQGRRRECGREEEVALEEPEAAVVGSAEAHAGFDHLVEHRLEPDRPCNRAKDTADRSLLLAKILELPSERLVTCGRAGHRRSLFRRRSTRRSPQRARPRGASFATSCERVPM